MSIKLNGWLLAAAVTTVLLIIGLLILTSAGKPAEQEAGVQTEQVSEVTGLNMPKLQTRTCYAYNGNFPNAGQATTTGNYSVAPDDDPCGIPETLCKICILDPSQFELDGMGRPIFGHPDNIELTDLVETASQNTGNEGQSFIANDTEVTFYFRQPN